jgi:hypothetical protein
MKNLFKRKKDKFPTTSAPRDIKEITEEYAQLRAQAGDIQYRVAIDTEDLAFINKRLKEVNQEAAARLKLDKEADIAKQMQTPDVKQLGKQEEKSVQ